MQQGYARGLRVPSASPFSSTIARGASSTGYSRPSALLRRRCLPTVTCRASQGGSSRPTASNDAAEEAVAASATAEAAQLPRSAASWRDAQRLQRVADAVPRTAAPAADLAAASAPLAATRPQSADLKLFMAGAAAAVATHYLLNFIGTLPAVRFLVRRFIWQGSQEEEGVGGDGLSAAGEAVPDADEETVEWVNMCWRKAWRVYQRGLERWLADLLQPVFDNLVADGMVPKFVQRLRIAEFTLDHEAPYFSNMRRRNSRKDSDLTGVVDVRYTGGARMLLLIECGTGRWRIKVPVMVSDLDLECAMWLKLRLAPMCPYIGTISLAFVGPPTIKVQLSPYNRVRLMRIPILQPFLSKLLTVDLPALMTLPKRLEIAIPPAVTAVAEAAVGRDAVMRAVASAVLQADALEHALVSALPLGPQGAAGGISLPDLFQGELQVVLKEARDLPVWGFPWQSNPYCRLLLGSQAVRSRRDSETSTPSRHRAPVWNQEFQFLVEDPTVQFLELVVRDSPITGRTEVGRAKIKLSDLSVDSTVDVWLPVESSMPGERSQGAVHLSLTYRPFLDDEADSGYREAAAFALAVGSQDDEELMPGPGQITDVKSAADASSRAAVAASAAAAAVAVTKAAAARAAARLARAALGEGEDSGSNSGGNSGGKDATVTAAAEAESAAANGSAPADTAASSNGNGASNGAVPVVEPTLEIAAATAAAAAAEPVDLAVLQKLPPATDPAAQEEAVAQLEAMAATMQQLTEEVQALNSARDADGGDAAAAEAAAKAVAAAEALAVTAVVAGDVSAANRALQDAAAALEKTAVRLAAKGAAVGALISSGSSSDEEGPSGGVAALVKPAKKVSEGQTPSERAAAALAAAQAAAAAAAAAVAERDAAAAAGPTFSVDGESSAHVSGDEDDIEAALAADAIPGPARSRGDVEGDGSSSSSSGSDSELSTPAPWWNQALQMVPGVPAAHDLAADAAAEADGSAAALASAGNAEGDRAAETAPEEVPAWWGGAFLGKSRKDKVSEPEDGGKKEKDKAAAATAAAVVVLAEEEAAGRSGQGPVGDIIISPDIPIEEIAAEVQKSWKLRDRHVEALLQKAVESRQRRSERPWLVLTAVMATAAAVMLAIVLYRIQTGL